MKFVTCFRAALSAVHQGIAASVIVSVVFSIEKSFPLKYVLLILGAIFSSVVALTPNLPREDIES